MASSKTSIPHIFVILLLFVCCHTNAQKNSVQNVKIHLPAAISDSTLKLHINKITVTGNRKTKNYIILREMRFKEGDSLVTVKLYDELVQAQQLIYNTSLFNEVLVSAFAVPDNANDIDIKVEVRERWYIIPQPQFKWVDRNFNEWAKTYKFDLNRVNYGIKFAHYNLTGRKDQLRIYLLNGYSRNIAFSYNAPYANPSLTEGFVVGAGFTQAKQLAYKTDSFNYTKFYPDSVAKTFSTGFVNTVFTANAGYSIRRGYYNRHNFFISFLSQKIADTVLTAKLNPHYFNSSGARQNIIDLGYSFQHTDVDNSGYTLKGVTSFISVNKRGLAFNNSTDMLTLEAGYSRYHDLGKNWYGSYNLYGKIKLPFKQPYINQQGLGYGSNFLRGLDQYVVDGVMATLVRSTLRKKICSFKLPLPFNSKSHPNIPFTFYAKTFADAGYVFNRKEFDTQLNNRLLRTAGFGIDIVSLYDMNLRLEYSFNQLGQKGLFLHTQSGF